MRGAGGMPAAFLSTGGSVMRLAMVCGALLAASLGACARQAEAPGDLSALGPPSARLVGHWATPTNDELYFGAVDPTYRTGSYVLVHPDKKVFRHTYRVDAEDPSDQHVAVTLLFADGERRDETYVIAADGRSMTSSTVVTGVPTETRLSRVDDATTR
jgi:hypothetical protein